MAVLVANDALKYPVSGAKVHGVPMRVERFDDEMLDKARLEIILEQPINASGNDAAEFQQAWEELHGSGKLPGLAGYGEDETDEHQLMVEAFDVWILSKSNT